MDFLHSEQDSRASYLAKLGELGDWAALLRCWMAHHDIEALQMATTVVVRACEKDDQLTQLRDFLVAMFKDRFNVPARPTEAFLRSLPKQQQLTVMLAVVFVRSLFQQKLNLSYERRTKEAEYAVLIAQDLTVADPPLLAFFYAELGRTLGLFPTVQSIEPWLKAIALYQDLASAEPTVYGVEFCRNLRHLARIYSHLGLFVESSSCFSKAAEVCRSLVRSTEVEVPSAHLVFVLEELVEVQLKLHDKAAAKATFLEMGEILLQNGDSAAVAKIEQRIQQLYE